jgi:hypothetical protein
LYLENSTLQPDHEKGSKLEEKLPRKASELKKGYELKEWLLL